MSVFLAALDTTIITTALPTISSHFNSVSGYIWIGSAFMLAAAASTPNWGKFSDIWGRKPIVLFASAIFFLGCALCGTAVSLSMLIIGRAVQGWGAGGLLTLVNIIIGDVFSERSVNASTEEVNRWSKCGSLTLWSQGAWQVLRHDWHGLGNGSRPGASHRWCLDEQYFVEMVLLYQLYAPCQSKPVPGDIPIAK